MLPPIPDIRWDIARQIGIRYAVTRLHPDLTGAPSPATFETLLRAKTEFANAGFDLIGLEGEQFPMDRIKEGRPGRDEDITAYQAIIRNMGALGLSFFSYSFMARFKAYRTSVTTPLRGGARTSAFDASLLEGAPGVVDPPASQEAMWENYTYFLKAIIPVAVEAGVRMALHPDDPPVPMIRRVPRIFGSADALRRAMATVPSPANALTFCQGNIVLFDEPLEDLIREFGRADRIAFVHFRDVSGTRTNFVETFHDNGPTDMGRMLRLYSEVGFRGALRPDHVPAMTGESDGHGLSTRQSAGYESTGRLYAVGYIRGLLEGAGIVED
jgi:mannonate dehydratase